MRGMWKSVCVKMGGPKLFFPFFVSLYTGLKRALSKNTPKSVSRIQSGPNKITDSGILQPSFILHQSWTRVGRLLSLPVHFHATWKLVGLWLDL